MLLKDEAKEFPDDKAITTIDIMLHP